MIFKYHLLTAALVPTLLLLDAGQAAPQYASTTTVGPKIVGPLIVGPKIVGPKIVGPKINCGFKDLFPCLDNKECAKGLITTSRQINGKDVEITNDCVKVKEAQLEASKVTVVSPAPSPKAVSPGSLLINGKDVEITNDCLKVRQAQEELKAAANAAPARKAVAKVAATSKSTPKVAGASKTAANKIASGSSCNFDNVSPCGQAFQNGVPIGGKQCTKIDGKDVVVETACAFLKMKQNAQNDGMRLQLNSGFRTNAKQAELFRCFQTKSCNNGNLAARPGFSNHQNGIALDLNVVNPAVFAWLRDNAARNGFVRTVTSEPHHWELRPGSKCNAFVRYTCKSN
ncbi:hypothetical protein HDU67_005333 [Dinochytrium kinnereticum]|nr:hypothetical protein HDU67_005333 [Dinochytrium kinnereticum]